MRSVMLIVVPLLLLLSGCATRWTVFGHALAVPASAERPTESSTAPASPNFKAVTVAYTPAAKEQIAAEPHFTQSTLTATLKAALRDQKLLEESPQESGDTLEILIEDFATRPTSNAVIFGYTLATGTLKASLEVRAPDGRPLRTAQIQARSRLTRPAGTDQAASFEPLYRDFAQSTARNLTGASEPVAKNH